MLSIEMVLGDETGVGLTFHTTPDRLVVVVNPFPPRG